ncbi:MAG: Na+/H+ antiporter NhaC family protein [Oscillospiraceae bacterium]|nr:Na+/H+ antiporter NhaC family protein [Oscillospiraceae bacterium]
MEMIQVGWLSILPPLIAIVLALITKEVISSLLVGIFAGTLIYACNAFTGVLGVAVGTVDVTFSLMSSKFADNVNIILFLCFLGALVAVITKAGGSRAYGIWAASKLKSKRSAQLATAGLGALIFIDDYFNCLTVGTVMKPVTDKYKVSRAKLAYIIDATAAPVCIIAPISSWAAAVGSNLVDAGAFTSPLGAFIASIPYNLYALLSLVLVAVLCTTKLDFGPMAKAEIAAAEGDLGAVDTASEPEEVKTKGRVFDLIIPVIGLIVFSVLAMLYTGGFFEGGMTLADGFGNCDSAFSLVLGGAGGLIVAFLLFVPRGVVKFRDFMAGINEGIKSMVPACTILTLAWTISGVCRDLLGTGEYVGALVEQMNVSFAFIPAIVFIVAALLSFSMGTAWGTFGILIPIVLVVMESCPDVHLLTAALAATLAGSVFGDHCSPISDTTILSSTGAGVAHMEHVSTQIPYALVTAVAAFIGYLAAGFSNGNVFVTLGVGLIALAAIIFGIRAYEKKKAA